MKRARLLTSSHAPHLRSCLIDNNDAWMLVGVMSNARCMQIFTNELIYYFFTNSK